MSDATCSSSMSSRRLCRHRGDGATERIPSSSRPCWHRVAWVTRSCTSFGGRATRNALRRSVCLRSLRGSCGHLSAREREVYDAPVRGRFERRDRSTTLHSQGTVKVHVHHVFDKLGIRSRSALALNAARDRYATSAVGKHGRVRGRRPARPCRSLDPRADSVVRRRGGEDRKERHDCIGVELTAHRLEQPVSGNEDSPWRRDMV